MSRQLVESILSKNMLEANDIFEAKLKDIREKKMYEMKRMYAAKMDEAIGGLSGVGGNPEELRAKGYKKAAPELERRKKEAKAEYKQAKKEYKKATGKSSKSAGETDYEGKGNAPWTMFGRAAQKAKKAIKDYEPGRPGEINLKVAKTAAKGAGSVVKNLAKELGNISGF
jgi:hypothetical protein